MRAICRSESSLNCRVVRATARRNRHAASPPIGSRHRLIGDVVQQPTRDADLAVARRVEQREAKQRAAKPGCGGEKKISDPDLSRHASISRIDAFGSISADAGSTSSSASVSRFFAPVPRPRERRIRGQSRTCRAIRRAIRRPIAARRRSFRSRQPSAAAHFAITMRQSSAAIGNDRI